MNSWKHQMTREQIADHMKGTLADNLGITIYPPEGDQLIGIMPISNRNRAADGNLHPGAAVAMAETIGSVASYMCIDPEKKTNVGLIINANHLESVSDGEVIGKASPVHLGTDVHIWEVDITHKNGTPVCRSRLTTHVLKKS